MTSEYCIQIFQQSIHDYHVEDNVNTPIANRYTEGTLEHLLYAKNWIDTVQWHLEDIIRDPTIDAVTALHIKRRIDASNQERTNMVEQIDDWLLDEYALVQCKEGATINTESPAWAIDRLSILELKIYHMQIEADRTDATEQHQQLCLYKLKVLLEQRTDLSLSINQLLHDIAKGNKKMKVYRQMKMYNDESLNPVLYKQKSTAR
ncbi:DUF4254 domain-containing protein [Ilyomonas limi]|uniref:DUF4254 domain-containing protein n=1 Tax=Ilyomonas limi TaxID=2575867 RepID=A0A4U3L4J1_9BACT|nr:DUF4254 domain-containing protein [Ilyomonas limi]TKK69244.1 DUF4254 domain-containing protein [Ilyomonas limi]